MSTFWNAQAWRGLEGEEEMLEQDWQLRGTHQAMSMLNALDPLISSADSDGVPTGGCYNGDYPDSYHDELNRRMEEDEQYEAKVDRDLRELHHNHQDR